MRRLFSTFADGSPGLGLLLMRLSTGIALIVLGVPALMDRPSSAAAALHAFSVVLGALVLVGLWTPIVGGLVALDALWNVFASGHPWRWIMIATLGAALALLGPGLWSADARLFGSNRVLIPDRKRRDPPPL